MQRETYRNLLTEALKHVANGEGNVLVDNPAKTFTERAKNGDFIYTLSDEQYMQALADVNSCSKHIWEMKECQSWYFILEKILNIKKLHEGVITRVVQTLAVYCEDKLDEQKEDYIYDPVYNVIDYDLIAQNDDISTYESDDCTLTEDDEMLPFDEPRELPKPPVKEEPSEKIPHRPIPSYHSLSTPQDIFNYLDEHVYGQTKAKRATASLVWNHAHKSLKRNLVLIGPSGSGKTELFRQLSKIYSNIRIIDASHLTADGWSGSTKIRDIFNGLTQEEAQHYIYVFDEFDKCAAPVYSSTGTNYSLLIQDELLKLIEGNGEVIYPADEKNNRPELRLKTDHMSFVFLGSFEAMLNAKNTSHHKSVGFGADLNHTSYDYDTIFTPNDLIQHAGFRPELAGRIHSIVQLQPLTADDYYAILQNPLISPITSLEEQYDVKLTLDDASKHQLAQKAADSHMGVRYMTARLTEMLDEKLFSDCDTHEIMLSCV